ncbi:hypothetical protein [Terriglobus saanensis]|uniref:Uncharacterized protein n=1 Tax=Terriglobus saanensis (strain ATCC BAA-1853 / DSM 23119 / SP1PR4) TaxID=401053 RepID=E8UZL2_TERSS|nr:hypothetical protein [Terriglobus saanensis]ADV84355.1 hypothetical protein AciPR4_3602 [Terriglobus saanensis SP1PR4]
MSDQKFSKFPAENAALPANGWRLFFFSAKMGTGPEETGRW